jgi:transposase-like protein
LRARIERIRLRFDTRVAEALLERPDLSQAEIGKQFGISQNVIRRVIKQFNISARKRGPKRGPKERTEARAEARASGAQRLRMQQRPGRKRCIKPMLIWRP